MRGLPFNALIASAVLAAAGYLAFSLWAGWQEVTAALTKTPSWGIAALLGLSLANYLLRFGRWQQYLARLNHSQPSLSSAWIYFSGFALTTTPGKAGEMLRGVFLKALGVPYTQSTAAFLSERLSDLVAILLLALPGLVAFPTGGALAGLGGGAVALILCVLALSAKFERLRDWLSARRGKARALAHGIELLLSARRLHRPALLLFTTALSLLAWSAEALGFHLLLSWLGLVATPLQSFAIYALAMLAGALSFLPGGLGGTEAVMISLLLWSGMRLPEAVAATVLIRLTTLWFAVVLGLMALPFASRCISYPAPSR